MVEHRPVDMKAVRIKIGLSQSVFSPTQGLSAAPLRDWEQHRREPDSAAKSYLEVIAREPEAVQRALGAVSA